MISGRATLDRPPASTEYAPFYAGYVARVPAGHILALMEEHFARDLAALRSVPADLEMHRYAPKKWSVRETVGHLSDAERVFTYRALRFGRGDETPLSPFDENAYVPASGHDGVSLPALVDELSAVHQATLAFFRHLPAAAWERTGTASGKQISVRALAWITLGHELHHMAILRERYGVSV
jgi:hypothetical protein